MMKNRNKTLLLILIVFLGISCKKDSEVFNESYSDIYGKWKLYGVSGGFTGMGHELNFNFLEIERLDNYSFIKNDTVLEYGEIRIDEQNRENLLITFHPDENSEIFMYDPEKYVVIYGRDTLFLNSPCCDRFNYHLVREK